MDYGRIVHQRLLSRRPANAKLSEDGVAWAKRRVLDGAPRDEVAAQLRVSKAAIDQLMIGRTWGHVQPLEFADDVWHGAHVNSPGESVAVAEAQTTAHESMPQAVPTCEFCGKRIVIETRDPDCCHQQTTEYHRLQLDSARNAARHVVYLRKMVEGLLSRVESLEARPRRGKA